MTIDDIYLPNPDDCMLGDKFVVRSYRVLTNFKVDRKPHYTTYEVVKTWRKIDDDYR